MDTRPLDPPVDVRPHLEEERAALVALLEALEPDQWRRIATPAWSVHDLAVHLVHDDLRRLSAQRDGHVTAHVPVDDLEQLVAAIDRDNEGFVRRVAPTLSPRLTVEALRWLGPATVAHLSGLAPDEEGVEVHWAGPGPHPNWLDVAREYTERWIHQQQIRTAVGRPGCDTEAATVPVLDTFVRAIPWRLPARDEGTAVDLHVTGAFARGWRFVSRGDHWAIEVDGAGDGAPDAEVRTSVDALWRRAVRSLDGHTMRAASSTTGPADLTGPILDLRAALVADAG